MKQNAVSTFFKGQKVIVTGGVGSVGSEIVRKLAKLDVATIRVIDNNESGLFDMEQQYRDDARLEFYLADITDEREMRRTFSGMDYCLHLAALKHVPSCERSPFAAVSVNIEGVELVGRVSEENGLKKVVFTSSDKAVNPTNVMGTSKLMGERLFTAMNFLHSVDSKTLFSSTRFGNVLGSRGSVVPLFAKQIEKGGPVTVTDERMTRFVMTKGQAADLVLESMVMAKGGEIFITKMPVLKITDLARVMIKALAPLSGQDPAKVELKITAPRPGEKLWEELSTDEEASRLQEGDDFLVVTPSGHTPEQRQKYKYSEMKTFESDRVYHSDRESLMDEDAILAMLKEPDVLPEDTRQKLLNQSV